MGNGCSSYSSIESRILKKLENVSDENTFFKNRYLECYPGVEEWLLSNPNITRILTITINDIDLKFIRISYHNENHDQSIYYNYDKLIPSKFIRECNTIAFTKYIEPWCFDYRDNDGYNKFSLAFDKMSVNETIYFLNKPKRLKQRVIRKLLFKFKLPKVLQKEIEKWLY